MEDDLLKKTKKKRRRLIAVIVVIALFCVSAVWGLSVKKASDAKAAKAKAASEQTTSAGEDSKAAARKDTKKETKKEAKTKTSKKTTAKETASSTSKDSTQESNSAASSSTSKKTTSSKYVTITIVCTELSNNMDKLKDEALKNYIPSSGVILAKTRYSFSDGDTVYDCLSSVCKNNKIQMESKYDSVYKSQYVKGINYLYEFDAGKLSGWLFKVNGVKPDYGASAVKLKNHDNIVWFYTINYTKD